MTKYRRFLVAFAFVFVTLATSKAVTPVAAAEPTIITTVSSESYISNYYRTIDENLTGNALASALERLLKSERNNSFGYKTMQTTAFKYTDVDPLRPNEGYIVSFYSGTPVKGYNGMNKEHTWPNSHGGGKIDNDPHMVRPTLTSENSARGNAYFSDKSSDGWDPAAFSNPKYRGIAARIIFYSAVIGYSSNLRLEDKGFKSGSGNGGKMGKLSDLLRWNFEYPVDQSEIIRNETLDKSLNYNRNPFIDNPALACNIWGATNSTTENICATAAPVAPTSITVSEPTVTLNPSDEVVINKTFAPLHAIKTVTYSSSDNNVATVSTAGVIKAHNLGSATITVTSTEDTSVKATVHVNVTDEVVKVREIITQTSTLKLYLGQTSTISATVLPSNAKNKTLNYASSNNAIFTVSSAGALNALSVGEATLTISSADGGASRTRPVTVLAEPEVTSVSGDFSNNASNSDGNLSPGADFFNGGSASAVKGFNGAPVVTSVTSTNVYAPRGSGVAIGTSNNAGTLRLNLHEDYYARKVNLVFNLSGKGETLQSITGSVTSNVSAGTYGSEHSNPSDGTPFVVTFSGETNYIEIQTTKRLVLQHIELFISDEGPLPDDEEEIPPSSDTSSEPDSELPGTLPSEETPSSSEQESEKGCQGSVSATIITTIFLSALSLVLFKKRKLLK